jgi:ethanolamine ammonia-lyase small subunit
MFVISIMPEHGWTPTTVGLRGTERFWDELRRTTQSRIGLGRAGSVATNASGE